MKILGTTKGAKKGRGFLVLAFMNQRGRGRDPEACLEYKLNILQFHPFYLLNLEGKTMWKSENIAMLISIRDIIFYGACEEYLTAW